jgi:hypothetical protein
MLHIFPSFPVAFVPHATPQSRGAIVTEKALAPLDSAPEAAAAATAGSTVPEFAAAAALAGLVEKLASNSNAATATAMLAEYASCTLAGGRLLDGSCKQGCVLAPH